jgi:lipopolysaccharide export system permease protein
MRILSRYLSSVVAGSILLVLMVIVSMDVLAAVIDGAGEIKGDYTFVEVLKYVGTTLPGRIYENIPLSALIGCLIGLGILAGNSELVVMRAAGVSLLRMVSFVLRPVLTIIIFGVLLGEFAVPYTDQLAEGRKMLLRGEQERIASASGLWNREGSEFIHINVVLPNGKLFGVTRYRFDEGRIEQVSFSTEARYLGDHWLEEEGRVTRFVDERAETDTFVTRRWNSDLAPDLLRLVSMPPASLSMANLYDYAAFLEGQEQDATNHWLAFWRKAMQPLTTISLVLVAVSFIFGPLREATMGFRIFAGVIIGIAFNTSQQFLGPASLVYGFEPFLAVLLPVLLCALVGLWLLRRAA